MAYDSKTLRKIIEMSDNKNATPQQAEQCNTIEQVSSTAEELVKAFQATDVNGMSEEQVEDHLASLIQSALLAAEERGARKGLKDAAKIADKREKLYAATSHSSAACAALIAEDIRALSPSDIVKGRE